MPLPPITCLKCGLENPVTVRFCKRCHMPTRYECPSCHHLQMQGGACEKCGIDFAKYAAMLVVQAQSAAEQARGVKLKTHSLYLQILLLPITSVVALYKMLMGLRNGD
jgi:hypothetical protein